MKLIRRFLILGILLPLAGCGGGLAGLSAGANECTTGPTDVDRVEVYPSNPQVVPTGGRPFRMAAQAYNACGNPISGLKYVWTSSKPLSVTVNASTGDVRGGVAGGNAIITAAVLTTGNNKTLSATSNAPKGSTRVNFVVGTSVDRTAYTIEVYPPNPVVAQGKTLQLVAAAYNKTGVLLPDASLSWRSNQSSAATVSQSGLVRGVAPGSVRVVVQVSGPTANGATGQSIVAVRQENGGQAPPPVLRISPTNLVMVQDEVRNLSAALSNPENGQVLNATITWSVSAPDVITLTNPFGNDTARITANATGSVVVSASASYQGKVYQGPSVNVSVVNADPTVSSDWMSAASLPVKVERHGLAASGGFLFTTGGVAGTAGQAGPRELVMRARMQADGKLRDQYGAVGWDQSESGDVSTLFTQCTIDPACMEIFRDEPGLDPQFRRFTRYQVFGHAQVATDSHLYVVGGIDAQVDLGTTGSNNNLGAVGPQQTRYSDRTLIATLGTNGTISGWQDGPFLPEVNLTGGLTDVPGAFAPALVVYQNKWLYLLGGWGWSINPQGNYVGRNRDEIYRAEILADGTLGSWVPFGTLPEPLNKHAAAIVDDLLVISGGATGINEASPEAVTNKVWYARLSPLNGSLGVWNRGPSLPAPLEYHAMVNVPGDYRLVVIGGDNLNSASREAYYLSYNRLNGTFNPSWGRLPLLPDVGGRTAMAATAVKLINGTPVKRIFITGGGSLIAGSDFELIRNQSVYYIDLF